MFDRKQRDMNGSFSLRSVFGVRRAVAALAGLACVFGAGLSAQAQNPNDTVLVPMPYSWPSFHAGGTSPGTVGLGTFNPNPNLLAAQMQGTPSAYLKGGNGQIDEVASYLLGNYFPSLPPALIDTLDPNNFRDAAPFHILEWFSPLPFTIGQNTSGDPTLNNTLATALIVDDNDINGSFNAPAWSAPVDDGSATNQEYRRLAPVTVGTGNAAVWTLPAAQPVGNPAVPLAAGFYVVTFHIPDATAVPATGTTTTLTETRIADAHYVVQDITSGVTLADTRVSQTEANSNQYLAGPFFLAAGDQVRVTLDNTTKGAVTATSFVVADSVSLQPGFGANLQGTAAAINATDYPEIQNALYYGIAGRGTVATPPVTTSTPDPTPYGNVTLNSDVTINTSADAAHRVRSMVYYGRQETIVLQDKNGNLIDANGKPVTVPIIEQVGAIYGVDGQNGEVVWRYQTPSIVTPSGNTSNPFVQSQPSREVFSTPVVARINVVVPKYTKPETAPPTLVHTTKLVVIVGDNNGMVYCLDAVGARDGTSNSDAVSIYDQPIYAPQAPLDAGMNFNPSGAQDVDANGGGTRPHVGNTIAYWIYRPDPAGLKTPNGAGKIDASNNLPVPGSFGTASPVVFVNPDSTVSKNAYGIVSSYESDDTTLTTNATIYMGNSNGTLYALDAYGGIASTAETYNKSRDILDGTSPNFNAGSTFTPTTEINWWLPLNGAKTSNTSANITAGGYETIVSTPAIFAVQPPFSNTVTTQTTTTFPAARYIYVTSADDTDNEGRLYAVQVSGFGAAETKPKDIDGNTLVLGAGEYNDKAISFWEFPNRYVRSTITAPGQDKIREALGSITGSPVVFTDPHGSAANGYDPLNPITRVYIAACSGLEYGDTTRPTVDETGRIWAVDAKTGQTAWAYPDALDPNVTAQTTTIHGTAVNTNNPPPDPLGAFRFSTPAIGMVQFPATIVAQNNVATGTPVYYQHTDPVMGAITFNGTETTGGVANSGPVVPMLYVGSAGNGVGQQGPRFYGLDLDGRDDTERQIFQDIDTTDPTIITPGIPSPSGNFETSPALIVNATNTTTPPISGLGNGGAIFIASGATMYQISATPITSRDPAGTQPIFNPEPLVTGNGALTSPAVSGYLNTDVVTGATTPVVRDWVYFGDSGFGIMDAITPGGASGGSDATALENELPLEPTGLLTTVIPQFPLFSYIFDGSTAHPGTSTDMTQANQVGGALPLFEWGQNVYIRIGNVVPPNTGDPTTNGDILSRRIYDPDDPTIFFTNGGPVTIQISDLDPGGNAPIQTDSGQVPVVVLEPPTYNYLNPIGGAIPNGFVKRTDGAQGTPPNRFFQNQNERLGADTSPTNGWIAAYTYAIRDGSARRNTPGATRRVVTATQVVQAYTVDAGGAIAFKQSVTLQTTITQGGEYTQALGPTGLPTAIKPIFPVDQPTFGILNPLAVRGGGVSLFDSIKTTPAGATQIGQDVGPFNGVNTNAPTANDLVATANGNNYYTQLPANGVTTTLNRGRRGRRRLTAVTSVGDINHGSTGSNADTKPSDAPSATVTSPLPTNSKFGAYALNIADRSALGLVGQALRFVTIDPATMRWTDNTGNGGPGALVNPLPWESLPHGRGAGSNTSLDYPDIASRAMQMTLLAQTPNGINGDITGQPGTPDPAAGDINNAVNRTVQADPVQLQVTVPLYQPANLQIFDNTTQSAIGPDAINSANDEYPMGYVAQQRVFVDSNHNGKWDDGEAYRTFGTFGGVPVSMSTTIETPTVDLGKLPEGLGLQTENYAALGTFMPYPTTVQTAINNQTPGYMQFFKPLTVFNRGNTNLLNVHFDQKVDSSPTLGGGPASALPLVGDFLDASALIPAADLGGTTGPRGALPFVTGINAKPFLLRTSLDSDLTVAYGRNPGLGAPYNTILGASFHKSRVGDASPTVLTVPDVPHDNDPTQAGNGFNLALTSNAPPILTGNGLALTSAGVRAASVPYVGLAIPQGTPTGTYSQSLRLFEGVDPNGYHPVYTGKTTYVPLLPPQYNGQIINPALGNPAGASSPSVDASDVGNGLIDTWIVPDGVTTQPYSTPTTVKATVIESRITNGNSKGNLPQVDNAPTNSVGSPATITSSANFLPSAFRDPATGNVSMYWTTSRSNPYALLGANLDFSQGYFQGYFALPANPTWWKPINPNMLGTGVNTAINVTAPAGGSAYAFVTNVTGGAGASAQNRLFCYPVNNATGALSPNGVPVTGNTSQPFFGVHGLTLTGTFADPYPASTLGNIDNNLWAFWYGGARGRSVIYFASAKSTDVAGGTQTAFGPAAVLPIPAGLVSVSDPTAVLSFAPDPTSATNASVPVIEVTYTGISADGNADIYVSRYRPYFVRQADPTKFVTDANGNKVIGLALQAAPFIHEQLQATDGNLWWQARDVAWSRNGGLNVTVNNTSLLLDTTGQPLTTIKATFDRASGNLVYTGLPSITVAGKTVAVNAMYVDLARGRVRFSFSPQVPNAIGLSIYATMNPQARRITTDSRADSAPIAFIDTARKPNEANSAGAALGSVETDRYWYIWRKSGSTGTSTTPTLFYKTQRLTIDLLLRDASTGQPISIQLINKGSATAPDYRPNVTVTLGGTKLYDPANAPGANVVDVDWVRGRIYFPIFNGATAMEGQLVTITGTDKNNNPFSVTDNIHWMDEPRFNESQAPTVASGTPVPGRVAITASATGDAALPIDTVINESNITAFLDPKQPHKVWLFWNSTRNGTADLYYETISPLFSATPGG